MENITSINVVITIETNKGTYKRQFSKLSKTVAACWDIAAADSTEDTVDALMSAEGGEEV